jgi:hypothetical protein
VRGAACTKSAIPAPFLIHARGILTRARRAAIALCLVVVFRASYLGPRFRETVCRSGERLVATAVSAVVVAAAVIIIADAVAIFVAEFITTTVPDFHLWRRRAGER